LVIDYLMVHAATEDDILLPILDKHREELVAWMNLAHQQL